MKMPLSPTFLNLLVIVDLTTRLWNCIYVAITAATYTIHKVVRYRYTSNSNVQYIQLARIMSSTSKSRHKEG